MGYVLSTERMRVAVKNERGAVVRRKQFKRGDTVTEKDLEHLEGRFEALVNSGALVNEDDYADSGDANPLPGRGPGNSTVGGTTVADLGFSAEGGSLPEGVTLNSDGSVTISKEALEAQGLSVGDLTEADEADEAEDEDDDEDVDPEDQFDPAKVEDFESMDYPTLQRLAKARTGNGAGGKDDLVARLEAHAAEARAK